MHLTGVELHDTENRLSGIGNAIVDGIIGGDLTVNGASVKVLKNVNGNAKVVHSWQQADILGNIGGNLHVQATYFVVGDANIDGNVGGDRLVNFATYAEAVADINVNGNVGGDTDIVLRNETTNINGKLSGDLVVFGNGDLSVLQTVDGDIRLSYDEELNVVPPMTGDVLTDLTSLSVVYGRVAGDVLNITGTSILIYADNILDVTANAGDASVFNNINVPLMTSDGEFDSSYWWDPSTGVGVIENVTATANIVVWGGTIGSVTSTGGDIKEIKICELPQTSDILAAVGNIDNISVVHNLAGKITATIGNIGPGFGDNQSSQVASMLVIKLAARGLAFDNLFLNETDGILCPQSSRITAAHIAPALLHMHLRHRDINYRII
ncbi:MAG: hypothetical protein L3J02_04800, partial [Henriciella sp.]|nr:hypothetical protein [Henriciella sp.]